MFPPLDPLGDPNSLDLGVGPAPTAPTAPTFGESPDAAHKRRLMQIVASALAAGLGPGRGTGILQGVAQHQALSQREQQIKDQQAAQLYQQQHQDYRQTQQDFEQESAHRQQAVASTVEKLRTLAPKIASQEEFDRTAATFAQGLQSFGIRITPDYFKSAVPYTPPDHRQDFADAVETFLKNPVNKAYVENPALLTQPNRAPMLMVKGERMRVPFNAAATLGGVTIGGEAPAGKSSSLTPGSFEEYVDAPEARKAAIRAARKDYFQADDKAVGSADEPIQPDDVLGAAQAILAHRMAPSQLSLVGGMGNRGVKFKQAVVAEVNKQDPAYNWQEAESGYQFGKSAGTQTTVRYIDNIAKTVPMLRAANQAFKRSNIQIVNGVLQTTKSQIGNVQVADFNFKLTLLADEIAKVLQGGGTGSGTSDAKLRQAQALLDGKMSAAQLETVLDAAQEMLKVRRASLTDGTFMAKPDAPTVPAPAGGGLPSYQEYLQRKGGQP